VEKVVYFFSTPPLAVLLELPKNKPGFWPGLLRISAG